MRLTQRVIHTREPLLLQDTDLKQGEWIIEVREIQEELAQYAQNRHDRTIPRSWLSVPMIAANNVVGVIGIQQYDNPHAYGLDQMRLLSTIALWGAIALENARLFDQISTIAADLEQRVAERTAELEEANSLLRQEKERLEAVHVITMQLTATLNPDEIISRALELVSTTLNVSRGSIMIRDLERGDLICRATLHEQGVVHPANLAITFDSRNGLSDWVIQHRQPARIGDVRRDTRWVMESGRAEDARSVVAVPLMTSDSVITSDAVLGVLLLSSPDIDFFTDAQLRLLETIAHEVAIALNNAQLYSYITEMATKLADLLEQQKEENTKSRSILQSLSEGVIVLDQDQHIALFNLAAEHILNIAANDLMNEHMTRIAAQGRNDSQRKRARLIYNALHSGLQKAKDRLDSYSMSFELPDPPQTIAMTLAQVISADERRYGDVIALRDITREIEADRAKREFVSKVSHELRTPLTVIKGFVDLLLIGKDSLNSEQIGYLKMVQTNTNRLRDLVNDILDISRIEAGKIELNWAEVDMTAIIHDVVAGLRLETERKSQQVLIDMVEHLPIVHADQRRISQVFSNLFSNAVKYTYDEGSITVRAFLNPANMVQVEVSDTGVGMSPDQLKQLFRPFYRADNPLRDQAGGTGLGLSIAKSLVEQHNGEMWVTSEPGRGSTFSFILPLQQPTADPGNEVDRKEA